MKSKCQYPSALIKFDKVKATSKVSSFTKPIVYDPAEYSLSGFTGKGVKIALLDTGYPSHKDVNVAGEKTSLCEQSSSPLDKLGHATMMAGVIVANNRQTIRGIAPNASLIYGKVVSNSGDCTFTSIVAGILWAVIKQADIIVLGLGTEYDYSVLHDAIRKAHSSGVCIFAAAGEDLDGAKEVEFPAGYKEVFSCGFLTRSKAKNEVIRKKIDFCLPPKVFVTTCLGDQYMRVGGSSIATAFFAGLAANFIESYRRDKGSPDPFTVFSGLKKICNEKFG
jgi:subtilisin family serine protease